MAPESPSRLKVSNWDAARVFKYVQDQLSPDFSKDELAQFKVLKVHGRLLIHGTSYEFWTDRGMGIGMAINLSALSTGLGSELDGWDRGKVVRYVEQRLADVLDEEELARFRALGFNGRAFRTMGTSMRLWEGLGFSMGVSYELFRISSDTPVSSLAGTVMGKSDSDECVSSSSSRSETPEPDLNGFCKDLCRSLKRLKKAQGWNETTFSDPTKQFLIPLPVMDLEDSRDASFKLDKDRRFKFMGRSGFKELYTHVLSGPRTKTYHATKGHGMSLNLAALAALLLASGKRVVYISNCNELTRGDPVHILCKALCIAFHNRPHKQDEITKLSTRLEVAAFCANYGKPLIFIFDQVEALEDAKYAVSLRKYDSEMEKKKADLRDLLDAVSYTKMRVFCSSGNDVSARLEKERYFNDQFLDFNGGFNKEEMTSWWRHQAEESEVVKGLTEKEKEDIERITGGVPLYLTQVVEKYRSDWICKIQTPYREVIQFAHALHKKYQKKEPSLVHQYYDNLKFCLRGSTCPKPNAQTIDHRFFFYDPTAKKIIATAGFIHSAAQRLLNQKSPHLLSVEDYLEMIGNAGGDISKLGFAAVGGVVSSILDTGLKYVHPSLEKPIEVGYFGGSHPAFNLEKEGTRMYLPDRYYYSHDIPIDIFLVHYRKRVKSKRSQFREEVALFPVRVSLDYNDHADHSERALFERWRDWVVQLKVEGVKVEKIVFVWVTKLGHEREVVVKADALGFKHPEYTRRVVHFSTVGPEVWDALEGAEAYTVVEEDDFSSDLPQMTGSGRYDCMELKRKRRSRTASTAGNQEKRKKE